jgi:uncharacterized repeat protein (TIGR03803 family)
MARRVPHDAWRSPAVYHDKRSIPMALAHYRVASSLVIAVLTASSAAYAAGDGEVLQLVLANPGGGSIEVQSPSFSCATACSTAVPAGDTVVLTAHPGPGRQFEGWAGDCSGWTPTCELLMDGGKLAVASFKPAGDPFAVVHRFLPGTPFIGSLGSGGLLADSEHLFGFTLSGGRADRGTIFRELPDGSEHTVLHEFFGGTFDGAGPTDLIALDGVLLGTTTSGGAHDRGTIFRVNEDGSGFEVLRSFAGGADGAYPRSLIAASGVLYGTTAGGGPSDLGTVFKVNADGSGLTLLHSFSGAFIDGSYPSGALLASGGALFGVTSSGGYLGYGTVFRINPDGSGYTILHKFNGPPADGSAPGGALVHLGGALYGVCSSGGAYSDGSLFKINPDGSGYSLLHSSGAPYSVGSYPVGPLVVLGGLLYGVEVSVDWHGDVFSVAPDGSGFSLVHSFVGGNSDGADPCSPLLAMDGALAGMTSSWSGPDSPDYGKIYKLAPDGSGFALLHVFERSVSEATAPTGSLTELDGLLYGMTSAGGVRPYGTIFSVTPDGSAFTVLHSFASYPDDGDTPVGSLVASGNELCGMTMGGSYYGTVFRIRQDGSGLEILHSFTAFGGDGAWPVGSLLLADGWLYGTTQYGGTGSCPDAGAPPMTTCGTVFKVDEDGSDFTVLHSFHDSPHDGRSPTTSLVLHRGVLYGLTDRGGAYRLGAVFKVNMDGTGFALLHSFVGGGGDGAYPNGALVESGGFLYGTTSGGGLHDQGVIFRIRPDGSSYALVHVFAGDGSEGGNPEGPLVATGGALYGTTWGGGPGGAGTAFRVKEDGTGFTVLHAFSGPDGASPRALTPVGRSLVGVALTGGLADAGVIFRLDVLPTPVRRHLPSATHPVRDVATQR